MAEGVIEKRFTDISYVTKFTYTVTTGSTGNIALSISNDGVTAVVAPHVVESMYVHLRTWISTTSNSWYLTAINPNTGETINNTSLKICFWAIKFSHA